MRCYYIEQTYTVIDFMAVEHKHKGRHIKCVKNSLGVYPYFQPLTLITANS